MTERYEIEVMQNRTVVLHDNATGRVVMSSAGSNAFLDCLDEKRRLEWTDAALWEWIKE